MAEIAVFGSVNMDIVNRVARHPLPGETILGESTVYCPGGKGANQAVAAVRAGAGVAMLGAVGADGFGAELRRTLGGHGIDTGGLVAKPGTSGLAFITVDAAGENEIVLSAGANGRLDEADADRLLPAVQGAYAVLLQNEIPWAVTRRVMERARREGVRVILNPAPAFAIPEDAYPWIDLLVANESEAEALAGLPVADAGSAELAADRLLARGAAEVVVTLGKRGSLYKASGERAIATPAYRVRAKDTTAAGDTFIGALAAAFAKSWPPERALRFASAAAAVSVTRTGAQSSIPTREEIEAFMRDNAATADIREGRR